MIDADELDDDAWLSMRIDWLGLRSSPIRS